MNDPLTNVWGSEPGKQEAPEIDVDVLEEQQEA